MKIRNGFVSNSSSSSFLMVGLKVDMPDNMPDFLAKLLGITEEELENQAKEYFNESIDCELSEDSFTDYCIDSLFELSYEDDGFDIFVPEYRDYLIVGREIASTYNTEVVAINPDDFAHDEFERFDSAAKRLGLDVDDSEIFLGGM